MSDELRKVSRRSFLSRVVGGAVIGTVAVVATVVPAEEAEAFQTDNDPHDPVGGGRRRRGTGITDRDPSDPAGNGRGRRRRRGSGITDRDPRDPVGNGRGRRGRRRSCSDSDGGRYADPGGRGRRC